MYLRTYNITSSAGTVHRTTCIYGVLKHHFPNCNFVKKLYALPFRVHFNIARTRSDKKTSILRQTSAANESPAGCRLRSHASPATTPRCVLPCHIPGRGTAENGSVTCRLRVPGLRLRAICPTTVIRLRCQPIARGTTPTALSEPFDASNEMVSEKWRFISGQLVS